MLKSARHLALLLGALLIVQVALGAQTLPACIDKLLATHIVSGLGHEKAYRLFRKVKGYNPQAQSGVQAVLVGRAALDYEHVDNIIESFTGALVTANPMKTDEAIFDSIGRLTAPVGGEFQFRDGLDDVIRRLGSDINHASAAKGAAGELYMARLLADEAGSYDAILGFGGRIDVPGTSRWRVPDIRQACGGCGPLGYIQHEIKNLTEPVVVSAEELAILTSIGDDFARDILIHADTNFAAYRLTIVSLRPDPSQLAILRAALLKQVDAPLLRERFPTQEARDLLADRVSAALPTFLAFK